MSRAYVAALFIAVAALLLEISGLAFDPSFAARRPDHDHLYLGVAIPQHVHAHELLSTGFRNHAASPPAAATAAGERATRVLNLEPYDGMTYSVAPPLITACAFGRHPASASFGLVLAAWGTNTFPLGTVFAPITPPPRACIPTYAA